MKLSYWNPVGELVCKSVMNSGGWWRASAPTVVRRRWQLMARRRRRQGMAAVCSSSYPWFFACGSLAMNLQKWLESVKTVARTKPNALIRRMQQVTQIILDSCNALHSLRVVRLSQYRNLSCSCHGIPNGILDIFGWLRLQKPPTRSSRRKWRSN